MFDKINKELNYNKKRALNRAYDYINNNVEYGHRVFINENNIKLCKYIYIWINNIKLEESHKKIEILEKRLILEKMKYKTYRKECDFNLKSDIYKVCNICNSYIYPLYIEEWLDINLDDYNDILDYEKYEVKKKRSDLGISKVLLSCTCD